MMYNYVRENIIYIHGRFDSFIHITFFLDWVVKAYSLKCIKGIDFLFNLWYNQIKA